MQTLDAGILVCRNVKPEAFNALVNVAFAVQVEAFSDVPEVQLVYKAVPAIDDGVPTKPYRLFVADEEVLEQVVKMQLADITMAPAGIVLRSNMAQPALDELLMVVMFPSFLVPDELTEPVLYDPAAPVAVTVTVVWAGRSPHTARKSERRVNFLFMVIGLEN